MVSLLPLLVAVAVASAATPTASPAPPSLPTPLTIIGTTHTGPCATIVNHANGAIGAALDDDRSLAILAHNMRAVDLDMLSAMQRRNAIDAMMDQAGAIRKEARAADADIKQLRAAAEAAHDPERKAELKAFADALGGAIARQDKAATEFMGSVTVMQGRVERAEANAIMAASNQQPPALNAQEAVDQEQAFPAAIAPPPQVGQYDRFFAQLSDGLTAKSSDILRDEGVAADHSITATSGC
ncbi:MAG TPA: hypothetical protein VMD91_01250 [Candidatus Sulfotelmatobacter sp.]|nr:hypothetical protein [Candidatus Sulfotelmatobacter sp.]